MNEIGAVRSRSPHSVARPRFSSPFRGLNLPDRRSRRRSGLFRDDEMNRLKIAALHVATAAIRSVTALLIRRNLRSLRNVDR
jgi:hypothetical protein